MVKDGYSCNIPKIFEEALMCKRNNISLACISKNVAEARIGEEIDVLFMAN